MMNYDIVIDGQSVKIQFFAERIKGMAGDLEEYFSQKIEDPEDAFAHWIYGEEMQSRIDIIFDYAHRIEQIGVILECLASKLTSEKHSASTNIHEICQSEN